MQHNVDQGSRGAEIRTQKEEVSTRLGHPVAKTVVEEVSGYDDNFQPSPTLGAADPRDDIDTRGIWSAASVRQPRR